MNRALAGLAFACVFVALGPLLVVASGSQPEAWPIARDVLLRSNVAGSRAATVHSLMERSSGELGVPRLVMEQWYENASKRAYSRVAIGEVTAEGLDDFGSDSSWARRDGGGWQKREKTITASLGEAKREIPMLWSRPTNTRLSGSVEMDGDECYRIERVWKSQDSDVGDLLE